MPATRLEIIEKLARELGSRGYNIRYNLNKESPVSTGTSNIYPDAYIYNSDSFLVEAFAVETTASIRNQKTLNKLKKYSKLFRNKVKFSLVVPKKSLDEAKKLVESNKLAVTGFWYY